MRSYYFKNFIISAGIVMLSFIIMGASFIGIGRSITINERRDGIDSNALELSRLVSAHSGEGSLGDWDLRMTLSSIAESTGNHCFICTAGGIVVSCSDTDFSCGHIGRVINSDIIEAAQNGGYSGVSSLNGFYDVNRYVSGQPVYDGGEIIGYVFVGSDTSAIALVWKQLMDIFIVTSVSMLLITLILSYIVSVRQTKPINDMAEAALKFAHGDFSARVDENRDDEIGALAAAFNNMADSLDKSERRRSEFIANVAHELKTPMTTISGFADGILDGTIPPEQSAKYLETISSETKRLNRLVRRMLDMSRYQSKGPEELRKSSFDAGELLLQTLLVFEKKIDDKRLIVEPMIPEDSVEVLGDADAINQVMYNLLENAVKFAAPGSELGVGIFKQDDKAYVSVKNHGDTIPPEELALIFDRFHKTDKSRSMDRDGVGLGLYIVKCILNNHGEDIAVTSREGVTEFVFSLSLKPAKGTK